MDPHRLAEERSIAYHRTIAERLLEDPRVLAEARRRVAEWLSAEAPPYFAHRWQEVLARDPASIGAFLVDPGERARELRQSTPFAGVLSPRERWAIWRSVAARGGSDDA